MTETTRTPVSGDGEAASTAVRRRTSENSVAGVSVNHPGVAKEGTMNATSGATTSTALPVSVSLSSNTAPRPRAEETSSDGHGSSDKNVIHALNERVAQMEEQQRELSMQLRILLKEKAQRDAVAATTKVAAAAETGVCGAAADEIFAFDTLQWSVNDGESTRQEGAAASACDASPEDKIVVAVGGAPPTQQHAAPPVQHHHARPPSPPERQLAAPPRVGGPFNAAFLQWMNPTSLNALASDDGGSISSSTRWRDGSVAGGILGGSHTNTSGIQGVVVNRTSLLLSSDHPSAASLVHCHPPLCAGPSASSGSFADGIELMAHGNGSGSSAFATPVLGVGNMGQRGSGPRLRQPSMVKVVSPTHKAQTAASGSKTNHNHEASPTSSSYTVAATSMTLMGGAVAVVAAAAAAAPGDASASGTGEGESDTNPLTAAVASDGCVSSAVVPPSARVLTDNAAAVATGGADGADASVSAASRHTMHGSTSPATLLSSSLSALTDMPSSNTATATTTTTTTAGVTGEADAASLEDRTAHRSARKSFTGAMQLPRVTRALHDGAPSDLRAENSGSASAQPLSGASGSLRHVSHHGFNGQQQSSNRNSTSVSRNGSNRMSGGGGDSGNGEHPRRRRASQHGAARVHTRGEMQAVSRTASTDSRRYHRSNSSNSNLSLMASGGAPGSSSRRRSRSSDQSDSEPAEKDEMREAFDLLYWQLLMPRAAATAATMTHNTSNASRASSTANISAPSLCPPATLVAEKMQRSDSETGSEAHDEQAVLPDRQKGKPQQQSEGVARPLSPSASMKRFIDSFTSRMRPDELITELFREIFTVTQRVTELEAQLRTVTQRETEREAQLRTVVKTMFADRERLQKVEQQYEAVKRALRWLRDAVMSHTHSGSDTEREEEMSDEGEGKKRSSGSVTAAVAGVVPTMQSNSRANERQHAGLSGAVVTVLQPAKGQEELALPCILAASGNSVFSPPGMPVNESLSSVATTTANTAAAPHSIVDVVHVNKTSMHPANMFNSTTGNGGGGGGRCAGVHAAASLSLISFEHQHGNGSPTQRDVPMLALPCSVATAEAAGAAAEGRATLDFATAVSMLPSGSIISGSSSPVRPTAQLFSLVTVGASAEPHAKENGAVSLSAPTPAQEEKEELREVSAACTTGRDAPARHRSSPRIPPASTTAATAAAPDTPTQRAQRPSDSADVALFHLQPHPSAPCRRRRRVRSHTAMTAAVPGIAPSPSGPYSERSSAAAGGAAPPPSLTFTRRPALPPPTHTPQPTLVVPAVVSVKSPKSARSRCPSASATTAAAAVVATARRPSLVHRTATAGRPSSRKNDASAAACTASSRRLYEALQCSTSKGRPGATPTSSHAPTPTAAAAGEKSPATTPASVHSQQRRRGSAGTPPSPAVRAVEMKNEAVRSEGQQQQQPRTDALTAGAAAARPSRSSKAPSPTLLAHKPHLIRSHAASAAASAAVSPQRGAEISTAETTAFTHCTRTTPILLTRAPAPTPQPKSAVVVVVAGAPADGATPRRRVAAPPASAKGAAAAPLIAVPATARAANVGGGGVGVADGVHRRGRRTRSMVARAASRPSSLPPNQGAPVLDMVQQPLHTHVEDEANAATAATAAAAVGGVGVGEQTEEKAAVSVQPCQVITAGESRTAISASSAKKDNQPNDNTSINNSSSCESNNSGDVCEASGAAATAHPASTPIMVMATSKATPRTTADGLSATAAPPPQVRTPAASVSVSHDRRHRPAPPPQLSVATLSEASVSLLHSLSLLAVDEEEGNAATTTTRASPHAVARPQCPLPPPRMQLHTAAAGHNRSYSHLMEEQSSLSGTAGGDCGSLSVRGGAVFAASGTTPRDSLPPSQQQQQQQQQQRGRPTPPPLSAAVGEAAMARHAVGQLPSLAVAAAAENNEVDAVGVVSATTEHVQETTPTRSRVSTRDTSSAASRGGGAVVPAVKSGGPHGTAGDEDEDAAEVNSARSFLFDAATPVSVLSNSLQRRRSLLGVATPLSQQQQPHRVPSQQQCGGRSRPRGTSSTVLPRRSSQLESPPACHSAAPMHFTKKK